MKKTGWFALFVAVLVAGTYYIEFYQVQKEEAQKNEEAKIVSFAPDQIHQVEIENTLGKVLLQRDADGWRLEEPVKDWADNQFTEDFINGLAAEKSLEVAAEGDTIDWARYGLDQDFSKVLFTQQQGKSILVSVSKKKNFEGNGFLRRGTENKVLVASGQWALRTQKAPLDFRDKRLFRGKIGSVEGIYIKSEKDQFELVNKESRWLNEKQPLIKVDQNKVREILTSLNEVRALDFVEAAPGNAKPRAEIKLQLKDKTWSAEIRETPEKALYGVVQDPALVLKLDPGQMDKFLGMQFSQLRDRKEAFDFQNLRVRRIELQTVLKKMTLIQKDEKWYLAPDEKVEMDLNSVRSFITRLSDSAVSEYLAPSEQAAFKDAGNKIVLKDAEQKVLFEISWGPTLKKKAVVGEKTLILAKSSLYKEPFGLDQSVIDSWGLMNLQPAGTKKPAEKKEPL